MASPFYVTSAGGSALPSGRPLLPAIDLGTAFRIALENAIAFLVKRAGLTPLDAYSLCSLGVSFRVTQVVDVNNGVHAMIPKSLFAPALARTMTIA